MGDHARGRPHPGLSVRVRDCGKHSDRHRPGIPRCQNPRKVGRYRGSQAHSASQRNRHRGAGCGCGDRRHHRGQNRRSTRGRWSHYENHRLTDRRELVDRRSRSCRQANRGHGDVGILRRRRLGGLSSHSCGTGVLRLGVDGAGEEICTDEFRTS